MVKIDETFRQLVRRIRGMISIPPFMSRRIWINSTLALAMVCLAACASDRPRRGQNRDRQVIKVSMQATSEFYHGQLHVEANVSNGEMRRPEGDRENAKSASSGKDRGGSGGSMSMGGGGRMKGGSRPDVAGSSGPSTSTNRMGSNQPPILLTLRLENTGTADLDITIREINSAMGNFVPQPERLQLAPGQSAELEPMISRLGVIANEIPLQLSFRSADQIESQTTILRNMLPPDDPEPIEP